MANFYAPGAIELSYVARGDGTGVRKYLGTAVEAPEIFSQLISTPFTCDLLGAAPFQQIFNCEVHQIVTTLNRLNYQNWQKLKTYSVSTPYKRVFSTETSTQSVQCGQTLLNQYDFELYLEASTLDIPPTGAMKNRKYFSALLVNYHESTINTRVEEITVVIDCYPLLSILEAPISGTSQNGNPSTGSTVSILPRIKYEFDLYEENTNLPAVSDPSSTSS